MNNYILPNSIDLEQSVIGALLIDETTIAAVGGILTPSDFYDVNNRRLYSIILEINKEGLPLDIEILKSKMTEDDKVVYNDETLMAYLNKCAVPSNAAKYAEIIKQKAVMRDLIKVGTDVIKKGQGEDDLSVVINEFKKEITQIELAGNFDNIPNIRDIVVNSLNIICNAIKNKGTVTGVPSGFSGMDELTSGFQKSDFILLAARPSMGKTALALNIASDMALKQNKSVAVFSLEMSSEQLMHRILSMESGLNSKKLKEGTLLKEEWERILDVSKKISESSLFIDDTAEVTVSRIKTKCFKIKEKHGLDAVFIDYLQLIAPEYHSQSRQNDISEISRALKCMAKELNVPVISLSQLSRAVEQRPDKRPMLSDLRDSGAIEQDADVVMFIYRDDYYNPDTENPGVAEINIAKQRNGPTGYVDLRWVKEFTRFTEL